MSRRVLLIAVLFTAIADPALANWWIVRASDGKCIVVDIEPTGKDKTVTKVGKNSYQTPEQAEADVAHGFQEYWGYLYHLDAMQQLSFPDINKTPTVQGVAPPCKNTPVPGLAEVAGAVDPKTTLCLTPPRPVIWCKSSDGTEKNQTCNDEGPLTLERSKTVDEEISAKVIDFLDRNDPAKTNKPFFVWYNPARMHVVTVLPPKYEAMLGERGGKDWGTNEAGMKQMDDNIGDRPQEAGRHGPLDNTIVVFTTDNGAEAITFPDGGITPFRGQKARLGKAATVRRWSSAGRASSSRARCRTNCSLRSTGCPRFVDIAAGQGQRAEGADRKGRVSRHRQDHARWFQPDRLSHWQIRQVGARLLLLLSQDRRCPRCGSRTGRCIGRWHRPGRRAGLCRSSNTTSP